MNNKTFGIYSSSFKYASKERISKFEFPEPFFFYSLKYKRTAIQGKHKLQRFISIVMIISNLVLKVYTNL